jgi:hypothetical protein
MYGIKAPVNHCSTPQQVPFTLLRFTSSSAFLGSCVICSKAAAAACHLLRPDTFVKVIAAPKQQGFVKTDRIFTCVQKLQQ